MNASSDPTEPLPPAAPTPTPASASPSPSPSASASETWTDAVPGVSPEPAGTAAGAPAAPSGKTPTGPVRGPAERAEPGYVADPGYPDDPEALIRELEAQERKLVLRSFSPDDAWHLGSLLVELARLREAPVAVDIRRGCQQLFHYALPRATSDNDAWIDRKCRVVERYAESSYLVATRFRAKGTTFEESSRLDPGEYAAHGGAFPLTVAGAGVIGAIAVSGLPQADDHALVVEALERFLQGSQEFAGT